MKNHLILTGLNQEFKSGEKNIFLGSWVEEIANKENLKIKNDLNPYHWANYKKAEEDYEYLKKLYEKILLSLTFALNKYHNYKFDKRYWEVIIGWWLGYLITILWDRWELVRNVFEKFDIASVNLCQNEFSELRVKDFSKIWLSEIFFDKYFNHLVFSEIIRFKKYQNLKLTQFEIESKKLDFKSPIKKKSLKASFYKLLNKIYYNRQILFYQANLHPNKFFSKKFLLKNPIFPLPEFDENNFDINYIIKDKFTKLDFKTENEFENFLIENLHILIPLNITCGLKSIKDQIKKIKFDPKIVFTMYGHASNDFFKIWLADKMDKGKKLIICEHGGDTEQKRYFDFHKNVADKMITHTTPKNNSEIQLPPTFAQKKNFLKTGSKLLYLCFNQYHFSYRIHNGPIGPEMQDYFLLSKNFLNRLNKDIKKSLIIRQGPLDIWKLKDKFRKYFGKKYVSNNKNLYKDLFDSKVVINTCFGTTYIQTMVYNKPTILLLSKDLWNINKNVKNFYEVLKENKLIFTDFEQANYHLSSIWDNPLDWWESKEINKIKKDFNKHFANQNNDQWIKFFDNIVNEINV